MLQKILNGITIKIKTLHEQIAEELANVLEDARPSEAEALTRKIYDKHNIDKEYQDLFLATGAKAADISVPAFRKYYKGMVSVDGERLSSKIHDLSRVDEIADSISKAIRIQDRWAMLARDLVSRDITQAELPKYIEELRSIARKAVSVTGDPDAYMKYKKQINKIKDQELAQAYRNLAKDASNQSDEVLAKSIDRAIMFKARANATQLFNTEVARAYGNAKIYTIQNNDDAIGIRLELSEQHDKYCECDFFANSDLYGMGSGIYPKDQVPEYPIHPYCACDLIPVYKGKVDEYDDEAAQEEFDNLEPEERQALVGKDGDWKDFDWEDHKVPEMMEAVMP